MLLPCQPSCSLVRPRLFQSGSIALATLKRVLISANARGNDTNQGVGGVASPKLSPLFSFICRGTRDCVTHLNVLSLSIKAPCCVRVTNTNPKRERLHAGQSKIYSRRRRRRRRRWKLRRLSVQLISVSVTLHCHCGIHCFQLPLAHLPASLVVFFSVYGPTCFPLSLDGGRNAIK